MPKGWIILLGLVAYALVYAAAPGRQASAQPPVPPRLLQGLGGLGLLATLVGSVLAWGFETGSVVAVTTTVVAATFWFLVGPFLLPWAAEPLPDDIDEASLDT